MARVSLALFTSAVLLVSTPSWADDCDCQGAATCCQSDCQSCCQSACPSGCQNGICSARWNRPLTECSQPDVFYNFYQPGNCGVPAAAFPAPFPTPPNAGRLYVTYQPLMPNELLYMHHRTYHQAYNKGFGLNRTSVHWHGTPIRTELKELRKFFSLAR